MYIILMAVYSLLALGQAGAVAPNPTSNPTPPAVLGKEEVTGRLEKARQLLGQGQFERALQEFNEVIKTDPNSVDAICGRSEALLNLGDGKTALRWAKMATSLAPDNPSGWHLTGEAYAHESNQDYPRAEEAYRRELKLDPASLAASLGLAKALSYQKKVDEAVRELQQALQKHPDEVTVMLKLAESYFVLRKLSEAEEVIKKVLAKDPGNQDALRIMDQVSGRQAYQWWVIGLAAVFIPLFYFGVRWLKKGRVPKV